MKRLVFFLMIIFTAAGLYSFTDPPKDKVNWISFSELEKAYTQQPKPIIIDLYTNWCGWCKVMDKSTYGNEKVAAYINKNYYAVKFNAESSDSVVFNKIKYGFNKAAKTHELALQLSFGERAYPNTIFLENINARPAPLSGYLKPKEIEAPMRYFVERVGEENFVEFNKKMKSIF